MECSRPMKSWEPEDKLTGMRPHSKSRVYIESTARFLAGQLQTNLSRPLSLLSSSPYLILYLPRLVSQPKHTTVIDVKDVEFVHEPPAEHLGSILDEPPAQRPAPHKDLQHVGLALDETFGLDAVRVRFGPEHGGGRGAR